MKVDRIAFWFNDDKVNYDVQLNLCFTNDEACLLLFIEYSWNCSEVGFELAIRLIRDVNNLLYYYSWRFRSWTYEIKK